MDLLNLPDADAFLRPPGMATDQTTPDLKVERQLADHGLRYVCGVDEAGRGPLAGPVVCAAVILDPSLVPDGLNDSKQLTKTDRVRLYGEICAVAHVDIAVASPATIDRLNIRAATLGAMAQCVTRLLVPAHGALIDGNVVPRRQPIPMWAMIKGDGRSASIAAASIVAKTVRDALMQQADTQWPQYEFARHMGYPTERHRALLARYGPCPIHRRSFAPVRAALSK